MLVCGRCIVLLYKLTSPTNGLACIIQPYYLFSQICVDGFANVNVCYFLKLKEKLCLCVNVPQDYVYPDTPDRSHP